MNRRAVVLAAAGLAGGVAAAGLGALLLVLAGAAPASAGQAAAAQGEIVDFEILPAEITVRSGDTLTWVNRGNRPHTVTDRGGMFDTNPILPGESGSVTVDAPGTYEIFCRINPARMNARIRVEPADGPPAAVRIQALDENREGETRRFDPAQLTVAAGTQLVMANVGGLPHSLRADDGSFRIPVVEPGAEQGRFAGGNGTATLERAGTFGFFCEIHPVMRGTVTVTERPGGDGGGRAPPPPTTAPPHPSTAVDLPAGVDAVMVDFGYQPAEVRVTPGATVTFRNQGVAPHTVTFDDLDIDVGPVAAGEDLTITAPDRAGTYSYYCALHPMMRGALLVSPPAVPEVTVTGDDVTDGTLFAYAVGALLLGTGAAGLALGVLRRPG